GLGMQFGTNVSVLDGVTYQGALDLSETSAHLNVLNGLKVTGAAGTGPGVINLTGNSANLTLTGSQTLDNATVRRTGSAVNVSNNGTAAVVTFGPNLTIQQASVHGSASINVFSSSDSLINKGVIFAAVRGSNFSINGGGGFTNQGSISVGNGDSVSIS